MTTPPQPPYGQPPDPYGQPQAPYGPPQYYGQPVYPPGPSLELAGWWSRVGATIVDGIIVTIIGLIVGTAIAALAGLDLGDFSSTGGATLFADFNGEQWDGDISGLTGDGWIWLLIIFVTYAFTSLLYPPLFLTLWKGQTPGKKMAGIRVVTEQGAPPRAGTAWLREFVAKGVLINGIGGAIAFGLPALLSSLWPLWDNQSRAGHDFIARTRVISAAAAPLAPGAPPSQGFPPQQGGFPPPPPNDFLGNRQ